MFSTVMTPSQCRSPSPCRALSTPLPDRKSGRHDLSEPSPLLNFLPHPVCKSCPLHRFQNVVVALVALQESAFAGCFCSAQVASTSFPDQSAANVIVESAAEIAIAYRVVFIVFVLTLLHGFRRFELFMFSGLCARAISEHETYQTGFVADPAAKEHRRHR